MLLLSETLPVQICHKQTCDLSGHISAISVMFGVCVCVCVCVFVFVFVFVCVCVCVRGLHGGPETHTGSGLYFKWSAGSGSGPNLYYFGSRVFLTYPSRSENTAPASDQSACMCFCNLQFVKLG